MYFLGIDIFNSLPSTNNHYVKAVMICSTVLALMLLGTLIYRVRQQYLKMFSNENQEEVELE
jgi:hypothetical protein